MLLAELCKPIRRGSQKPKSKLRLLIEQGINRAITGDIKLLLLIEQLREPLQRAIDQKIAREPQELELLDPTKLSDQQVCDLYMKAIREPYTQRPLIDLEKRRPPHAPTTPR
jgi:hypothetical protein